MTNFILGIFPFMSPRVLFNSFTKSSIILCVVFRQRIFIYASKEAFTCIPNVSLSFGNSGLTMQ